MGKLAEDILRRWRDIHHPGSYSGLERFYRGLKQEGVNVSKEKVRQILEEDLHFQTTRDLRKNFPRRRDMAFGLNERLEADLGDLGPDRFTDMVTGKLLGRYFFIAINVFSKRVYARGLKNKSADTVLEAFKDIVENDLHPPYTLPHTLEVDRGKEFNNKPFKEYLKSKNVFLSFSQAGNKARNVERSVRSMKRVLLPFLENHPKMDWNTAVQETAQALNRRFNRSIAMAPDDVPKHWRQLRNKNLKSLHYKPYLEHLATQKKLGEGKGIRVDRRTFHLGDTVIIPHARQVLDKESDSPYSSHIYTILHIRDLRKPYLFDLADGRGNRLKRLFYAREIKKVKMPEKFPVSSIQKTKMVGKKKYALVRWSGYDSTYDSWVPISDIITGRQ